MNSKRISRFLLWALLAVTGTNFTAQNARSSEQVYENFKSFAEKIPSDSVAELALQSHGRLKPLDTFAREAVLFITGKYSRPGLNAVQIYLGLMVSEQGSQVELINIRDPELRDALGFSKKQRHFSLQGLETSRLQELAAPALAKQERNERGFTPAEKATLEAMQQVWLMRGVLSGQHLLQGLAIPVSGNQDASNKPDPAVYAKTQEFLKALAKAHLFLWAAILYLVIGLALVMPFAKKFQKSSIFLVLAAIPFLLHIAGFAMRVYITGVAPVTNMYGTMIWVAFGIVLFGSFVFMAYRNAFIYGFILLGAALALLLTESLPLVLSPDLDPIVAVLRNNFWLTIHVLTITISYAAFTIGMLLGNFALIRSILSVLKRQSSEVIEKDKKIYAEYGMITYRVTQIGVFFLTAGIILGGIWADYSWGRFWGWDPKETWSLIADLGYLAILHAKYLGWLGPFGLLASSPVAYLLVIMAWYGVNFILASGLHSYGFSSGGAFMVAAFVTIQLVILAIALAVNNWKKSEARK